MKTEYIQIDSACKRKTSKLKAEVHRGSQCFTTSGISCHKLHLMKIGWQANRLNRQGILEKGNRGRL